MTLHYADPWLTVYAGDCREAMAAMAPESVHCVVTSPPYWGLRDYGTATWGGGEEGCDHTMPVSFKSSTLGASTGGRSVETHERSIGAQATPYRHVCGKCGARRIDAQLGLEPTPEEYVADIVAVFREVRRVLRSDGTVWLNLGDSYASSGTSDPTGLQRLRETEGGHFHEGQKAARAGLGRAPTTVGLKSKDLVGIPWRVAFALQADGWYLRSDIIWAKPNPMPESVTDRPTKAHEYLFLLTKSARYFYDADAVREPSNGQTLHDLTGQGYAAPGQTPQGGNRQRVPAGWDTAAGGHVTTRNNGRQPGPVEYREVPSGRNLRSVWSIATEPYPGSHFATFPQKLVEPCIKAGTSERGVCPECGAPWVREVERIGGKSYAVEKSATKRAAGLATAFSGYDDGSSAPTFLTTGWRPSCRHDHEPVPAVVLDCFAGSGTVGRVAQRLSRRAVLIDLNPEYLMQAMERNRDIPLGLESA